MVTADVYVIDFGISKMYKDQNGQHIPYREGKRSHCGTARFCSLASHLGEEISRKDDLESIGYVLIYFLRLGHLPWIGLPAGTKEEKYKLIKEKMFSTTFDKLCINLP